jgi:hypothetical protein
MTVLTFTIACGTAAPGNAFPPLPPLAPVSVPMKRFTREVKACSRAKQTPDTNKILRREANIVVK